jgi:hypothetical protein
VPTRLSERSNIFCGAESPLMAQWNTDLFARVGGVTVGGVTVGGMTGKRWSERGQQA